MKIYIKGEHVQLDDERGNIFVMTTEQLLELVNTLNAATNEEGGFYFSLLEFTF